MLHPSSVWIRRFQSCAPQPHPDFARLRTSKVVSIICSIAKQRHFLSPDQRRNGHCVTETLKFPFAFRTPLR